MAGKSTSGLDDDSGVHPIGEQLQLREQLDDLLSRMQQMLIDDTAMNATAVDMLVELSEHVEAVGRASHHEGLAQAAKRLTITLKRSLSVGSFTNVVTRLDFWHQLIALKRMSRELGGR